MFRKKDKNYTFMQHYDQGSQEEFENTALPAVGKSQPKIQLPHKTIDLYYANLRYGNDQKSISKAIIRPEMEVVRAK